MYQDKGDTYIEEDDQCFTCQSFNGPNLCPLLMALFEQVAFLDSDVAVLNCSAYKKYTRHLRLVENVGTTGSDSD